MAPNRNFIGWTQRIGPAGIRERPNPLGGRFDIEVTIERGTLHLLCLHTLT